MIIKLLIVIIIEALSLYMLRKHKKSCYNPTPAFPADLKVPPLVGQYKTLYIDAAID
tara:strand:- start:21873 stop:22043 length:171 start_codon:yes stop_codon:yes gene_type:complete